MAERRRKRKKGPTNPYPGLFNRKAAKRKREDAIERVDKNAKAQFKKDFAEAIVRCAKATHEFTTDDVWPHFRGDSDTHDHRVLGPLMRQAAEAGHIVAIDRHSTSSMTSCNMRPKRVWRSLLLEVT